MMADNDDPTQLGSNLSPPQTAADKKAADKIVTEKAAADKKAEEDRIDAELANAKAKAEADKADLKAAEAAEKEKQAQADKDEKAKEKALKAEGMPKRVWIQLEENDEIPPTGLFLGHNGNGFLIKAGEPVNVPEFLVGILDAAVATMAVTDPTTRQVVGHRERMRYPYRRVAAPASAE